MIDDDKIICDAVERISLLRYERESHSSHKLDLNEYAVFLSRNIYYACLRINGAYQIKEGCD